MSDNLHVVFGTGPVGSWIASTLVERGETVRAVNRSGKLQTSCPNGVEIVSADASDPDAGDPRGRRGAPSSTRRSIPPTTSGTSCSPACRPARSPRPRPSGARYISIDNLYLYGLRRRCHHRGLPRSRPTAARASCARAWPPRCWRPTTPATCRLRSCARATTTGPASTALGVRRADLRAAARRQGRRGDRQRRHRRTRSPTSRTSRARPSRSDSRDEALGGVWFTPHAAAQTQRAMIEEASRLAGVKPRVNVVSPLMLRLVGLFSPPVREMGEMMYEFTNPFVVDSSKSERELGLSATPISDGLSRTIAWYRKRATVDERQGHLPPRQPAPRAARRGARAHRREGRRGPVAARGRGARRRQSRGPLPPLRRQDRARPRARPRGHVAHGRPDGGGRGGGGRRPQGATPRHRHGVRDRSPSSARTTTRP